MAQLTTLYKTKFRVENLVYEEILNSAQFEELRIHGMDSSVVWTLVQNSFTSAVIGNFKHKVEIMSVIPAVNQDNGIDQVQAMEVEVNQFFFLRFHKKLVIASFILS